MFQSETILDKSRVKVFWFSLIDGFIGARRIYFKVYLLIYIKPENYIINLEIGQRFVYQLDSVLISKKSYFLILKRYILSIDFIMKAISKYQLHEAFHRLYSVRFVFINEFIKQHYWEIIQFTYANTFQQLRNRFMV